MLSFSFYDLTSAPRAGWFVPASGKIRPDTPCCFLRFSGLMVSRRLGLGRAALPFRHRLLWCPSSHRLPVWLPRAVPLGPCGFLFPGMVQPGKAGSRCLFSPIFRGAVGFSFWALRSGLVWPRCRVLLTARLSVNLATPLWPRTSPVADTPARARFGGWRKPTRPCHSLPLAGVTGAPLVPLCWRCHTCQRLGEVCPASPNPSGRGRLGLRLPAARAGALPPPPHPVGECRHGMPAGGAGVPPAGSAPMPPSIRRCSPRASPAGLLRSAPALRVPVCPRRLLSGGVGTGNVVLPYGQGSTPGGASNREHASNSTSEGRKLCRGSKVQTETINCRKSATPII